MSVSQQQPAEQPAPIVVVVVQQAAPVMTPWDYLNILDSVIIKQRSHLAEIIIGWEVANQYDIYNANEQLCFVAQESSGCLARILFSKGRGMTLNVTDQTGQVLVWSIVRPCHFITDVMDVTTAEQERLGSVHLDVCTCCPTTFTIKDESQMPIFKIKGDVCLCCEPKFKIYDYNDPTVEIGLIQKKFSGLLTELFTDSDNFYITFPMELDVRKKAVLISAAFLIDFTFFEDNNN